MSWEQLGAIRQEAQQIANEQRALDPVACPRCGEPLDYNPRLQLLGCRSDGYRITGRPREG